MDAMTDVSCGTCRFYEYPKRCHRYPTEVRVSGAAYWCGEHQYTKVKLGKPERPSWAPQPVGGPISGGFISGSAHPGAILWNEAAASVAHSSAESLLSLINDLEGRRLTDQVRALREAFADRLTAARAAAPRCRTLAASSASKALTSAGSVTYKLRATVGVGTVDTTVSATQPGLFWIEDCGPTGAPA